MSAGGAAHRAADGSDEPPAGDERQDRAAEDEDDDMGEVGGPDTSDGSFSDDMADAAPKPADAHADTSWLQASATSPFPAAAAAHLSATAPAAAASSLVGGAHGALNPALGGGPAEAAGSAAALEPFALRPGAPTYASMAAQAPATAGAQAPSRLLASAQPAGGLTGLHSVAAALPGAAQATATAPRAPTVAAGGGVAPTGLFTIAAAKVAPENMAALQPDPTSLVALIAKGNWRALGWPSQDSTFVYLGPDPENPFLLRSLSDSHYSAAQEEAFREHVFRHWKACVSASFSDIGRALKPVDILVTKGQPEWGDGMACLSFCVRLRWVDCAPLISALLEGKTLTIPVSLDKTKPGPRLAVNIHTWVLTSPANRQLGGAAGTAIYAQIDTLWPGGVSRPARSDTRRAAIQSISYGGQAISFWHAAEAPTGEDYTRPLRRTAETRQRATDKATALHPHWGFLGISTAVGKEGPYFRLTCMNFSAQQAFEEAGEVLLPIYTAEGPSTLRLRFSMDIPGGDFSPEQRAALSARWSEFEEHFWPTAMWMEVVFTHHSGECAYTARFLLDALAASLAKKAKWGPRRPLRLMEVPPTVPEGPTTFYRTHERSELLSRIYFAVDWEDYKLMLTQEFCQIFLPQGDLCGKAVLFPHYKSAGGGRPRMTITTNLLRRNAWLAALPQDRPSNPPPVERRRRRGTKRAAEPQPDFTEEVACPSHLPLQPPALHAAPCTVPAPQPVLWGQATQCNAALPACASSPPAYSPAGPPTLRACSVLRLLPSFWALTYVASPPSRQRRTRTLSSRFVVSLRRRLFSTPRPLCCGSAYLPLPRFLPLAGCWLPSVMWPLGLAPTLPNLGLSPAWNCNSSPALLSSSLPRVSPTTNCPPRWVVLRFPHAAALPSPLAPPPQAPRPTLYLLLLAPLPGRVAALHLSLPLHDHLASLPALRAPNTAALLPPRPPPSQGLHPTIFLFPLAPLQSYLQSHLQPYLHAVLPPCIPAVTPAIMHPGSPAVICSHTGICCHTVPCRHTSSHAYSPSLLPPGWHLLSYSHLRSHGHADILAVLHAVLHAVPHSCSPPYLTLHLAQLLLSLSGDVHPNPGPVSAPPACFQLLPGRDLAELALLNFLARHNVVGDGHCGFYAIALYLGLLPLPAHPGILPPVTAHARAVVRDLRHTLTSAMLSDSPFHVEYMAQVFNYSPAALEERISALRLDFLTPGTWGCLHNLRSWISSAHFRAMAVALKRPIISFSDTLDDLTGTLSFNVHSPIPQYKHFRVSTSNLAHPFLYYEAGAAMPTRIANLCLQEIYSLMPQADSPIILSFENGNHWVPLIPKSRYPHPPPRYPPMLAAASTGRVACPLLAPPPAVFLPHLALPWPQTLLT